MLSGKQCRNPNSIHANKERDMGIRLPLLQVTRFGQQAKRVSTKLDEQYPDRKK